MMSGGRKELSTDGKGKVGLLLKNAGVLDVFSGTFFRGDIALSQGRIVGFGAADAEQVRDLKGRYVVPGLIDAHMHIESTQLSPAEFVRAVLPHGTTAVIADPHEIANVLGIEGIRYMLSATENLPFRAYFMAPSCVPASPFETSGAVLDHDEISEILSFDRVLGLGEVMNYPGVVGGDPEVMAKLAAAAGRPIDGHAPGLTGADLWSYVSAGPRTDHECTTLAEAEEKLRSGMHILIREGTTARNLKALLPLLTEGTAPFVHLCTDDRHPDTLLAEGHIDDIVRKSIAAGVPAHLAIGAATIHTARAYGLHDLGAIAPGYRADLIVLNDLDRFEIGEVYVGGALVAKDRVCTVELARIDSESVRDTVRIDFDRISLAIPCEAGRKARVIGVLPEQVVTEPLLEDPTRSGSQVVSDPERDLLKLAVVERHGKGGSVGLVGLKQGAIASTVAHDSHNAVAVGCSDSDILTALAELSRIGGGQVVVSGGELLASHPLPIAGLMSDRPLEDVASSARTLDAAAERLGCGLPSPFMTLSFLALPVIPHLKLTDRGLVDVDSFRIVPLFEE